MSSRTSFLRMALASVFVCVSAVSSQTATKIEPVITSNGAIVLQIAEMDLGTDLDGIQEYAVMVSDDLVNWQEIARTTLLAELRLVDFNAEGSPHRFYRVVGIDLDATVQLFAEGIGRELTEALEFTSGIALEGFTLEEYESVFERVDGIRAEIAGMLEGGAVLPESLLLLYRNSIGEIDRMLGRQPLVLDWQGEGYEIEISRAMQALNEQYQRLGEVTLHDYDRLPGVEAEDLEGLESLKDYIARRQVGMASSLPVFEAISPSGQFQLTVRLVRRHLDLLSEDVTDADADGLWEIDYGLYGRALNGLERLGRENLALAETLESEMPLNVSSVSSGRVLTAQLESILRVIDQRHVSIEESLLANVGSKGIDAAFEGEALSEARDLIRDRRSQDIDTLKSALFREGLDMELFPALSLNVSGDALSVADLEQALAELRRYRDEAIEKAGQLFDALELSSAVRREIVSVFEQILNGFSFENRPIPGVYASAARDWLSASEREGLLYALPEGGSAALAPELFIFLRQLPSDIEDLLLYPGISGRLDRSDFDAFFGLAEYNRLWWLGLDVRNEYDSNPLSEYAVRVQLAQALLLRTEGDLWESGEVDLVRFARLMLFGEELDNRIAALDTRFAEAISELESLLAAPVEGGSWRRFLAQKAVADSLYDALREEAFGKGRPVDRVEAAFVEVLAGKRWDEFWAALAPHWGLESGTRLWGSSSQPPEATISIVVADKRHEFSTRWLAAVMRNALERVAVPEYGESFMRYQWSRLNGLSEEDLAAVSRLNRYGPAPLDYLNDWGSPDRDRSLAEPNRFEMYLGVLPRWLESMDPAQILQDGVLSGERIEEAAVEGLAYAVAKGNSIQGQVRSAEDAELAAFNQAWGNAVFSHWEIAEAMEADYLEMKIRLADSVASVVSHLRDRELHELSGSLYDTSLRREAYEILQGGNSLAPEILDVGDQRFEMDFLELYEWANFWTAGIDSVRSAFPGLVAGDFEQAQVLNEKIYYTVDGVLESEMLYKNRIDFRKLVVAAIRRIVGSDEKAFDLYRDSLAVEGEVVSETLRRFFKEIDFTFESVLTETRDLVSKKVIELRERSHERMTIETLEHLYADVLSLRTELVALIEERTGALDSADVIEIEEAVTREYEAVFREFVSQVESEPLYVRLAGGLVRVPYEELRDALVGVLQGRFPGEDLAAYHFASFFGISVGELRTFDKLESFLNAQIVALPRNSQYVEVVSKLSDIGMRQFVALMVERFGEDVYDAETKHFDIADLLEIASEEQTGIDRAIQLTAELFDEATAELAKVENPNTLTGLEALTDVIVAYRGRIRSEIVDVITPLSESGAKLVRDLVEERNRALFEQVEELVFGKELRIVAIEGTEFVIDMGRVEEALVDALETQLEQIESDLGVLQVTHEWKESRLGVYLLVARLAYAFGVETLESGEFSVDRFSDNLIVSDASRLRTFADVAFEEEKTKLESLYRASSEFLTESELAALNAQISESRSPFLRMHAREGRWFPSWGRVYVPYVLQRWKDLLGMYEVEVFAGDFLVEGQKGSVQLPVGQMLQLAYDAVSEGESAFLDAYADGGESRFEYWMFANLASEDEVVFINQSNGFLGTDSGTPSWDDGIMDEVGFARFSRLPGVVEIDVRGLDFGAISKLQLPAKEAKDLMRGDLNLRVLAPGTALAFADLRAADEFAWFWGGSVLPMTSGDFSNLSLRDQRFRVIRAIVLDYWDLLVDENGNVLLEVFEQLIRDGV